MKYWHDNSAFILNDGYIDDYIVITLFIEIHIKVFKNLLIICSSITSRFNTSLDMSWTCCDRNANWPICGDFIFSYFLRIHVGRKNCKKICYRGMNFARTMLYHGNSIRSHSASMYDPAIWLAGMRLRGNSVEIGMLFQAVHDDGVNDNDINDDIKDDAHTWKRWRYSRSHREYIFSVLENESEAVIRLNRQFLFFFLIFLS